MRLPASRIFLLKDQILGRAEGFRGHESGASVFFLNLEVDLFPVNLYAFGGPDSQLHLGSLDLNDRDLDVIAYRYSFTDFSG